MLGAMVTGEGRWRPHARDGYRPVAVDVTGFWRPRLCDCPTTHYQPATGKALPGIPVGLIARVGSDGAFTTWWTRQPDYGEDSLVIGYDPHMTKEHISCQQKKTS